QPEEMTAAALEYGTQYGRKGRGLIYVWAGGNGGEVGDNSNYDGYANSIHTIAVGASSYFGDRASYSEPGTNLVVAAPSGGGAGQIFEIVINGLPYQFPTLA
ncbi:MAG: S8 family serine peptidase, partial [Opitutae bacterium]